jgi:hypothetical protein
LSRVRSPITSCIACSAKALDLRPGGTLPGDDDFWRPRQSAKLINGGSLDFGRDIGTSTPR